MKRNILIAVLYSLVTIVLAQNNQYKINQNIPYYSDSIVQSDQYIRERCVLDIYYPLYIKKFPTLVWFHGGGLTEGNKFIPDALKSKGICVVAVNYRLYPKVLAPKYIEDAAAAVGWVFHNIDSFGGDSSLIFVSGHSAGAYLSLMVGLDKKWLNKYSIDANHIAGLIPLSGQAITHFTIRKEKGIAELQPLIDDFAPLFHVRADAPSLLLITGDRDLELYGRYEENAYLMRMMKLKGHKETKLYELNGYGHDMMEPAFPLLLKEIKEKTDFNTTH